MDIENLIMKCLQFGQIHISSYQGEILCAALNMHNQELERVFSGNGVTHLLMSLSAKVLNDDSLFKSANDLYPHPLAPLSLERNDPLFRMSTQGSVFIFLTKDVIHLEQYVSTMQSLEAKPLPQFRSGLGTTFEEALSRLQKSKFSVVTCVSDNPLI